MNPFSQHTFPLANAFTLRHPLTLLFLLVAVALMLTACGGPAADIPPSDAAPPAVSAESPAPNETLNVEAGNAVLADLVKRVGGARVDVHTLVPVGSDSHTWQSTPRDSVRITEADLLVSNGAGLSSQVERLIANAANDNAVVVVASQGLEAQELVELPFPGAEHDEDEDHELALAGRLLIGDGETGALSVIDLETGEIRQDAFDLALASVASIRPRAGGLPSPFPATPTRSTSSTAACTWKSMATTRTWWNGMCLPSAWTCRATVRYTFMWEASGQPCSTTVPETSF